MGIGGNRFNRWAGGDNAFRNRVSRVQMQGASVGFGQRFSVHESHCTVFLALRSAVISSKDRVISSKDRVISSRTFSGLACIIALVKLPFRPNWLLRLLALLAITVSGGALANQYFLRLEQAPKQAKQHDNQQLPAKLTMALFEQKKLEPPVFADFASSKTSVFIVKPKLEPYTFFAAQPIQIATVSFNSERSRAPPAA